MHKWGSARLLLFLSCLLFSTVLITSSHHTAQAANSSIHSYSVQMTYVVKDNYKNRLVNSKAAFDQLQVFFDSVQWRPNVTYSFLFDVLRGSLGPDKGFVMTEKGFGYGSCGASSLLNKLVQTATFRDTDGKIKPIFQSILVWTWTGDKTYGKYGATIYLDKSGKHKQKDYIWKLNPAYKGIPPQITSNFDMDTLTVRLTMVYSDSITEASGAGTFVV